MVGSKSNVQSIMALRVRRLTARTSRYELYGRVRYLRIIEWEYAAVKPLERLDGFCVGKSEL